MNNPRFKKLEDAQKALRTGNFKNSEKPGRKAYRNARYEIAFVTIKKDK